ncbi:helix-turn-helix transcriptional regulator [Pseudonocardia sp. NPDC046786]|uniref:helix-turn-helix transcriptional regulator n=1 Tax=Pseudonocardia sp. NPDC046786 TaxID=3155471 RepID=UPI0033F54104
MRNTLAELRRGYGWSQQRLAAELGVTRQTVISIEKGRFDPSLPLAFRLAAVFGRAIEDIFSPDPDPAPGPGATTGA